MREPHSLPARFPGGRRALPRVVRALLVSALAATEASAKLDINDRGPVLDAGAFAMRVTNAGLLGNAFFDRGLSFDPSLEFPRGSGHEANFQRGARLELK